MVRTVGEDVVFRQLQFLASRIEPKGIAVSLLVKVLPDKDRPRCFVLQCSVVGKDGEIVRFRRNYSLQEAVLAHGGPVVWLRERVRMYWKGLGDHLIAFPS